MKFTTSNRISSLISSSSILFKNDDSDHKIHRESFQNMSTFLNDVRWTLFHDHNSFCLCENCQNQHRKSNVNHPCSIPSFLLPPSSSLFIKTRSLWRSFLIVLNRLIIIRWILICSLLLSLPRSIVSGIPRFILKLQIFIHFSCLILQNSDCQFPEHWWGSWFQKGVAETIYISRNNISEKGLCRRINGEKFLIENRYNE